VKVRNVKLGESSKKEMPIKRAKIKRDKIYKRPRSSVYLGKVTAPTGNGGENSIKEQWQPREMKGNTMEKSVNNDKKSGGGSIHMGGSARKFYSM